MQQADEKSGATRRRNGASRKLTRRTIESLAARDREYIEWDCLLSGFGLRVFPSGRKTFIVQYRAGRGRKAPVRKVTIGALSEAITPEFARAEAVRLLRDVALGGDPARDRRKSREAMTVAELCDLYLLEGVVLKKASSVEGDRIYIRRHIKPLLGRRSLDGLKKTDIQKLHADVAAGKTAVSEKTSKQGRARVRGGRTSANRAVAHFSAICTFAVERGLLPENPCKGVKKFAETKRERFLSADEFARLGRTLQTAEAEGINPKATAITRLLALTGARVSEIVQLRWEEVDLGSGFLRLRDSKTGPKIIHLAPQAAAILADIGPGERSEFVFPSETANGAFGGLTKAWQRISAVSKLEGVRLHDLRHSHASVAAAQGVPLAVIQRLLGHARAETTERYSHLSDDPVRTGAARVGAAIAAQLEAS